MLLIFFFNDTATTEIYTLSLHDALPISGSGRCRGEEPLPPLRGGHHRAQRSEEHTSELQSRFDLVCRLLLEKKKNRPNSGLSRSRLVRPISRASVAIHICKQWLLPLHHI